MTNQIAGFLNQLYLLNKMMKDADFLHVDTEIKSWLKIDTGMSVAWS